MSKIYTQNNALIIENSFMQKIIDYNSFISLLLHDAESASNKWVQIKLKKDVVYKLRKNDFWSKLQFAIYTALHNSPRKLNLLCSLEKVDLIINEIKKNVQVEMPEEEIFETVFEKEVNFKNRRFSYKSKKAKKKQSNYYTITKIK